MQRVRRDAATLARNPEPLFVYRCATCKKPTVTVRLVPGTVPASLGCRTTERCPGRGWVDPDTSKLGRARPRWEWYRPDKAHRRDLRDRAAAGDEQSRALLDYVKNGGLLIRRRG